MPRTKGSKNGISRTPGYTAVGQLAQERPAIDYRRDKRFSQVDYSAANKELLQRLAERRKNSLSSNAATINAAIQKSKDRLAENRAALAKQQAQALAKAKLQRIAAKQKVAESEEGGTNDWQRQAAGAAAGGMTGQAMKEKRIRSVNGLNAAGWDEYDRRVHGKSLGDYMKKYAEAHEAKVKYNKEQKKRKKSKSRRGNQNGKKS